MQLTSYHAFFGNSSKAIVHRINELGDTTRHAERNALHGSINKQLQSVGGVQEQEVAVAIARGVDGNSEFCGYLHFNAIAHQMSGLCQVDHLEMSHGMIDDANELLAIQVMDQKCLRVDLSACL